MSSLPASSSEYITHDDGTAKDPSGIIFLDIDGVLLPFPPPSTNTKKKTKRLFPDETLHAFSRLLKYAVGVKLVLSSTWRVRQDFQNDILDCFEDYAEEHGGPLREYATSGFYSITDPNKHDERQWEIFEWLRMNGYLDHEQTEKQKEQKQQQRKQNQGQGRKMKKIPWLALDDEELILGEQNEQRSGVFVGHVVKTSSHLGLTQADVDHAIELWKAQIQ